MEQFISEGLATDKDNLITAFEMLCLDPIHLNSEQTKLLLTTSKEFLHKVADECKKLGGPRGVMTGLDAIAQVRQKNAEKKNKEVMEVALKAAAQTEGLRNLDEAGNTFSQLLALNVQNSETSVSADNVAGLLNVYFQHEFKYFTASQRNIIDKLDKLASQAVQLDIITSNTVKKFLTNLNTIDNLDPEGYPANFVSKVVLRFLEKNKFLSFYLQTEDIPDIREVIQTRLHSFDPLTDKEKESVKILATAIFEIRNGSQFLPKKIYDALCPLILHAECPDPGDQNAAAHYTQILDGAPPERRSYA